LIPRVKGEDRDDSGRGGDGRIHEKLGNEKRGGISRRLLLRVRP
jgi:hypothetical protein